MLPTYTHTPASGSGRAESNFVETPHSGPQQLREVPGSRHPPPTFQANLVGGREGPYKLHVVGCLAWSSKLVYNPHTDHESSNLHPPTLISSQKKEEKEEEKEKTFIQRLASITILARGDWHVWAYLSFIQHTRLKTKQNKKLHFGGWFLSIDVWN